MAPPVGIIFSHRVIPLARARAMVLPCLDVDYDISSESSLCSRLESNVRNVRASFTRRFEKKFSIFSPGEK